MSKPENHGNKWTKLEEDQLLEELTTDLTIAMISNIHKRTTGGISGKIKSIAYKLYLNNEPLANIISITRLTEKEIDDVITHRKKKKQTSPTSTSLQPNDIICIENLTDTNANNNSTEKDEELNKDLINAPKNLVKEEKHNKRGKDVDKLYKLLSLIEARLYNIETRLDKILQPK